MAEAYAGTPTADLTALVGTDAGRKYSDRHLLERYLAVHDEAAFVSLVQRYARSVWGVCRRVLRQEQDAEDAFQAVFFMLARKAASIRKAEAVGSWLYGVAYRTAMKARQRRSTRELHEHRASIPAREVSPASEAAWRDLQRQLDEELQKLPEKYRAPFVLCCLQGMGRAEAARELCWKPGTVSSRLARARKILHRRLAQRGVGLSAVLMAVALAHDAASAAAPATLVQTTVTTLLASQATTFSPAVTVLAESVFKAVAMAKVKAAVALGAAVLTMILGGIGVTAAYLGTSWEQDPPRAAQNEENKARAAMKPVPPPPVKPDVEEVRGLAFSRIDHRLVTAGPRAKGHVIVWDADKGSLLASAQGAVSGVRAVAFSPDGKTVVAGDFGGGLRLLDARTGEQRLTAQSHERGVNAVAYSADGARIATAGLGGVVKVWNAADLREQKALLGHAGMAFSVAWFRDGKTVVSGGKDKRAILWNLETGKEKLRLNGHSDAVEMVAVSPDDRTVVTASWDKTIKLWDAENGSEKDTLKGHRASVLAIAISADGKKLASADASGQVFLWNLDTRKMSGALASHASAVWAVAFSSDGKYLASGSVDGTAKVWDLATGKAIHSLAIRSPNDVPAEQPAPPPREKVSLKATPDAPRPKAAYAQEYYHSFLGKPEKNAEFRLAGPDANDCVAFEPAGLRITLPLGFTPLRSFSGVARDMQITGDFEITLGFEILAEPTPGKEGQGTGFGFGIDVESDARDHARFNRVVRFNARLLTAYQEVTNPESGQKRNPYYSVPSQIKKGRLRLVRGGSLLAYYAAEEGSDDFQFIHHETFSAADVKQILIAATMGSREATEDVRILDLRVRADSLSETALAQTTPNQERRSLLYVLAIGIAATMLLGAFLLVLRRRRAEEASTKAASDTSPPAESSGALAPIPVKCSHCGKGLRIKPDLIGKKLKCPQCAGTVQVQPTGR